MPFFAKIRSGKGSIDLGNYLDQGILKLTGALPVEVSEKVAKALELAYAEPVHVFFSTVEAVETVADLGIDSSEAGLREATDKANEVIDKAEAVLAAATKMSEQILSEATKNAEKITEGAPATRGPGRPPKDAK